MIQPTEYEELSVTTPVELEEDSQFILGSLASQVEEVDSTLQHLREQKYADKESVFGVSIEDAVESINKEIHLPETELEVVSGVNDALWSIIYDNVLYPKERGSSPFGSAEDENGDPLPDGRLEWNKSLSAYRENNRTDNTYINFPTSAVTPCIYNGLEALEIDVDEKDSIIVYPEENITPFIEGADLLTVAWYSPMVQAASQEFANTELHSVEIALQNEGQIRQYVNKKGTDDEVSASDVELLENCEDPYNNPASMDVLTSVINRGYYTMDQRLLYGLYLSGERDAIMMDYGYGQPFIVDRFADLLDAHLTHIPQKGAVILSHDPLPELDSISDSFPEKQSLSDSEFRLVYKTLGYPESVIEETISDETNGLETLEFMAQLFDLGVINEQEMFYYQFCDWPAIPDEETMWDAVKLGQRHIECLEEFDSEFGVGLWEDLLASVERHGKIRW